LVDKWCLTTVRFIRPVLLATFVTVSMRPAPAVEFSATGISLPFFNPAGKLTHRINARHGVKSGDRRNLREVEIHYFAPDNPNVIVQKLRAEEATWDEARETLVGRGPVAVSTEENQLTGEGFDFAIATSLLNIHRNFSMSNRELVLTSDRAVVELIVERSGDDLRFQDVKRCEAIDNLEIVIQPTALNKYEFEKARSNLAVYDGATQTVDLPNRIQLIRKGQADGSMNKARIRLKPQPSQP